MGKRTEPPTVRVKLACADEAQFRREFAAQIASGFFLPTPTPRPLGDRLTLELQLENRAQVRAEAVVVRHGTAAKRPGMALHLVSILPGSIQFPLRPLPPAPAPEPAPEPAPPALEKTVAAPVQGSSPLVDQVTRVHQYEASQLRAAAPEIWSGGLRQFDVLRCYQLLKRLGGGGMAEVFLARSTLAEGVEKLVALKTTLPQFGLDTPFGALFLNEARLSVTLQHPNVVQVFDFGEAAGRPYLAMEYIQGRNLGAILREIHARKQAPRIDMAIAVVVEVLKALEYLHDKRGLDGQPLNLVHRDVSPANIIISARGEVKLVDFGVAAASTMADAGDMLVGKYAYMAPEQAKGAAPTRHWDIYALGVVLHEMLTLQRLFGGDTTKEVMEERRQGLLKKAPPSATNPAVPLALDEAVMAATHPESHSRFPSARDFRTALEVLQMHPSIGNCDLEALLRELFSDELAREQLEAEDLIIQGRRYSPWRALGTGAKFLWPLRWTRRRLASTRLYMTMARRPRLAQALVLSLALLLGGGGFLGWRAWALEEALSSRIELADQRIGEGHLVGPGGDTALDHLLSARELRPTDARALARLRGLADKFEELGLSALGRKDFAEAAAHFQASLKAEPSRKEAAEKLEEIEEWIRRNSGGVKVLP